MNNNATKPKRSLIYPNRFVVHLILFLISALIVFFVLNETQPVLVIIKSLFISLPSLFIYGAVFLIKDEITAYRLAPKPANILVVAAGIGIILFCLLCIYLFLKIPFNGGITGMLVDRFEV